MTSNKRWLTNLDTTRRSRIRFVDDRTLCAEGVGNIVIRRRNDNSALIENVLYVPEMKCNLLSIGQLIEKGFSVIMKNDALENVQFLWKADTTEGSSLQE